MFIALRVDLSCRSAMTEQKNTKIQKYNIIRSFSVLVPLPYALLVLPSQTDPWTDCTESWPRKLATKWIDKEKKNERRKKKHETSARNHRIRKSVCVGGEGVRRHCVGIYFGKNQSEYSCKKVGTHQHKNKTMQNARKKYKQQTKILLKKV